MPTFKEIGQKEVGRLVAYTVGTICGYLMASPSMLGLWYAALVGAILVGCIGGGFYLGVIYGTPAWLDWANEERKRKAQE